MNRSPEPGDKEEGPRHDNLRAMRSPSDGEDDGLHEAAKAIDQMNSHMMRLVLTQSLLSGFPVEDIMKCMWKQIKDAKKRREVTSHREETHDRSSEMPDSLSSSHDVKGINQDNPISSGTEPNATAAKIPSCINDSATFPSALDGHALPPQILNRGGTVNIYCQPCHAACPSARKEETPMESQPGHTVNDSDLEPDADISVVEKELIKSSLNEIIAGERNRAEIVLELLELTYRTSIKKWDAERGMYVSLGASITEEIKQHWRKQSDVVIGEGHQCPRKREAEPPALTGQVRRQDAKAEQCNTRVTFAIDPSDPEPRDVHNDSVSVVLPVPQSKAATHDTPKQRHSTGMKHKDMGVYTARVLRGKMVPRSLEAYEEEEELQENFFTARLTRNESKPIYGPPENTHLLARGTRTIQSEEKPRSTKAKAKAHQQKQAQLREGARTITQLHGETEVVQKLVEEPVSKYRHINGFLARHAEENVAAGAPNAVASNTAGTDNSTKSSAPANAQHRHPTNSGPNTQPSGSLTRVGENEKMWENHMHDNAAFLDTADGVGSRSSKPDKDRIALTAALDSIAKLALEAGPEAYQQQSEGNFSFLQGPTAENRPCRLCRKMFTDVTNVKQEDGSAPCSFHPGRLESTDPDGNTPTFTCCGGPPVMVTSGVAAVNLVGPGCTMCYHQDKRTAWNLDTFTMTDPDLFKD